MSVSAHWSSLRSNSLKDYATRFFFGGMISLVAGLAAVHFGPVIAGLLLAFPAIFPASATLIESHEKKKMARIGHDGTRRGRDVAAVEAEGTALGCIGLSAFAVTVWQMLPRTSAVLTFLCATCMWMIVSAAGWYLRRKF